jgi:DNA-binding NtrC family response regulator
VDGISLMKRLHEDPASPAIIVLTGKATVETAVEAMKNGAYDYLTKPYKLDELMIVVERAYEYSKLSVKSKLLEQELVRQETSFAFIGKSRQVQEILSLIQKVGPTDSAVFIQGESGTGKELVAGTVWHFSKRKDAPFIVVNCATLSENLIESEIFGHEKGAFTSAYQTKHGLVEVADKGSLFLDEIGEMPINLQAKLLRFLDSGEFRRVGGNRSLQVDVRVIAATNKDLTALIKAGKFREDLYYRLNVVTVRLPPLRERREDIPLLCDHFAARFARGEVATLSPEAREQMARYSWPGNVRELENAIARAMALNPSGVIVPEDLPDPVRQAKPGAAPAMPVDRPTLDELSRRYAQLVLKETGGNKTRAADILGIDRKTLYRLVGEPSSEPPVA